MSVGRTSGWVRRERVAGVALCALAVVAGQLLGRADGEGDAGVGAPGGAAGALGQQTAAPAGPVPTALPPGLDRHVAPDPGRGAARPAAAAGASADPGEGSRPPGAAACGGAVGGCTTPEPPPDSDLAAQVRSTGSAVPDYPGRDQVDPATGQVVDTGIASLPTEPVDVPVVTTTTPPPVISPTTVPPTTATTEGDLGSGADAPVG